MYNIKCGKKVFFPIYNWKCTINSFKTYIMFHEISFEVNLLVIMFLLYNNVYKKILKTSQYFIY